MLSTLRLSGCYQHVAAGLWQIGDTVADSSNQWSLLMAADDDEAFVTRSLNVTPETTEQHLIVNLKPK